MTDVVMNKQNLQ